MSRSRKTVCRGTDQEMVPQRRLPTGDKIKALGVMHSEHVACRRYPSKITFKLLEILQKILHFCKIFQKSWTDDIF